MQLKWDLQQAWSPWPCSRRKTVVTLQPNTVVSTLPCDPLSTDPALLPSLNLTWSPQGYSFMTNVALIKWLEISALNAFTRLSLGILPMKGW